MSFVYFVILVQLRECVYGDYGPLTTILLKYAALTQCVACKWLHGMLCRRCSVSVRASHKHTSFYMNFATAIKQNSAVDQLLETIATRKKNRTKNIFFFFYTHKQINPVSRNT